MFFVENERAGGNLFKSFDTVNKRDKSRIKTRPQYRPTKVSRSKEGGNDIEHEQAADGAGFQLLASGSKKQIPIIQREMAVAGGINKNTRERSFIIPTNFIGHGYGGRLS